MNDWFRQFVYCYECPAYRTEFNDQPEIPLKPVLKGEQLEKATKILEKCKGLGDGASLFKKENLITHGFARVDSSPSSIPYQAFEEEKTQELGFISRPAFITMLLTFLYSPHYISL